MPQSHTRFNFSDPMDWKDNEAILEFRRAEAKVRPDWWDAMPKTMAGYHTLHNDAMGRVTQSKSHIIPAGKDDHMVEVRPGSLEEFNRQMWDEIIACRTMRGADLETGLLPPKKERNV